MKQLVIITVMLATVSAPALAHGPLDSVQTRVDHALWLARSCVGEAGWRSYETGECAAIAWIYFKRAYNLPRRDYLRSVIEYSAAVKADPRRPWLRNLNRSGNRPRLLEGQIYWGKHQKYWFATLELADKFFRGLVPDPCPECLHYGGVMDIKRMDPNVWEPAGLGFKNTFWKKKAQEQ